MANKSARSNRMLISVNVAGSPGPIRLLVNEDDSVAAVIRSVLKVYARQRRLPVLGKDQGEFDLRCAAVDRALSSCAAIGSGGCRSFLMCTKLVDVADSSSCTVGNSSVCRKQPAADRFRSLLSKSLNLMISVNSH